MTLGESLNQLRTDKNMSQGDLADALGVSRQSVSKWETETSVPDFYNLIKISKLFNVTLDSLVSGNGAHSIPKTESAVSMADNEMRIHTNRIIGAILIAAGVLGTALLIQTIFIFITAYMVIAGFLCLFIKKHIGLILSWTAWLGAYIFFETCTSVSMKIVFSPSRYRDMTIQTIIAYALWLTLICLVVFTLRSMAFPGFFHLVIKKLFGLFLGWIVWVGAYTYFMSTSFTLRAIFYPECYKNIAMLIFYCLLAALICLIIFTAKNVKRLKE